MIRLDDGIRDLFIVGDNVKELVIDLTLHVGALAPMDDELEQPVKRYEVEDVFSDLVAAGDHYNNAKHEEDHSNDEDNDDEIVLFKLIGFDLFPLAMVPKDFLCKMIISIDNGPGSEALSGVNDQTVFDTLD